MNARASSGMVLVSVDDLRDLFGEFFDAKIAALVPKQAEPLLSSPELAERLGCSRAKVHQLAQDPTAPVIWLGDSRRWSFEETVVWLRERGRVAK
jgi:predicted DNA-binding transcriptional regulator AlpA